jgi:hypothetical protein
MPTVRFSLPLGLALTLFSGTARANDPALLRMADASSNFLVSVNLASIRAWPRAAAAFEQGKRSNPQWDQLVQALGVDPLELVDEVIIAGRVDNPGAKTSADNAALLLKGRFDVTRLTELICRQGCSPETVGAHTLLRLPEGSSKDGAPGGMVFFDSSYAALGKLDTVRRAAKNYSSGAGPQLNAAMAGWVNNLANYDVWIASSGPFGPMSGAGAEAMDPMAAGAMSKIAAFGLGIGVSDDVDLALQVLSNNESEASQLREMAQGLIALATLNADPRQPGMSEFLKRIQLSQQGNLVLASMSVPQDDIERAMRQAESSAASGAAEAMSGQPSSAEPAREGGIIIVGGEQPPERVRLKRSNR